MLSFAGTSTNSVSRHVVTDANGAVHTYAFRDLNLRVYHTTAVTGHPVVSNRTSGTIMQSAFSQLLTRGVPCHLLTFGLVSGRLFNGCNTTTGHRSFRLPASSCTFGRCERDLIRGTRAVVRRVQRGGVNVSNVHRLGREHNNGRVNHGHRVLRLIRPLCGTCINGFHTARNVSFPNVVASTVHYMEHNTCHRPCGCILVSRCRSVSQPHCRLVHTLHRRDSFALFYINSS